ncbi:MAG: DUF4199 domain-containing protein [Bacteroidia bacterium]|jgi:hypothetical protein
METKEQTHSNPYLHAASRYGVYLGLMLIGVQTIQYLAGLYISFIFSILAGSLFIAGLVWIIRDFRENYLNGWLSYGEGVRIGSISALAAGLLFGAFMLLLVLVIDKSYIDEYLIQTQEMMEASGLPDEDIENTMDQIQEGSNPWAYGYGPIFQFGVSGLLISLIASIFLRKDPANSFDKDTQ